MGQVMLHRTKNQASKRGTVDSRNTMKGWKQMKSGPYKITRQALPIVFVFALSGCSVFDYVLSVFDDDEPAVQTSADQGVRDRSDAQRAASDDADTPSLTTVPSRPEAPTSTNRKRVVEGLISDRENARYTDEAIRLQGSTRAPAASQSAARPAAPATVTTPAPAAPAPAARVNAPERDRVVPVPRPASADPTPSVTPPPPTIAARPATSPARPAPPPGPITQGSGSVIVDMSALGGGGYVPTSARVAPHTQVATIQFNHSSARLSAKDRAIILTVASDQREMGASVLVVGHASSRTRQLSRARQEVANFQVSFKRANAVAQALIQSGVPSNLVTVEAVSDDQPIYAESMPNGEAGNRRTEIFFLR
ncbi:MAG: hypothetical protein CMM26_05605 [Rhodospirillaceae bacterium]|nr:hypothetical protein [Rhodospirillaceae bacterium]